MAMGKDTVTGDAITQERKCQTVPKLQDHKPDQPSQQGYDLNDPQLTQSRGWGAAGRRLGRFQSRHSGMDINCRVLIEKHLQINGTYSTTSLIFRKPLTECGMVASGMSSEARKGSFKWSRPFINTPAVQFSSTTNWENFQTTVGIRQGCLLSPVLFNLFLEKLYRRPSKTTTPPSLHLHWMEMTFPHMLMAANRTAWRRTSYSALRSPWQLQKSRDLGEVRWCKIYNVANTDINWLWH